MHLKKRRREEGKKKKKSKSSYGRLSLLIGFKFEIELKRR
jgi:hypothetical protein